MAYIKVKSSYNASANLTYGTKKNGKIRENVVVNAINCTPKTAKEEFALVREIWGQTDGIQAHTIIQSFAEGEVDMAAANEIGIETAKRVFGEGFQIVVHTQCDGKSHLKHNHITANAVNFVDGKKYDNHALLWRAREISDQICLERGLSIIPYDQPTRAEKAIKAKGQKLWKDQLREIIEQAKAQSNNIDEFKAILRNEGITINERNSHKENGIAWTYVVNRPDWHTKKTDKGIKIRGRTLGDNYTCASITKSVSENIKMVQREEDTLTSVLKLIANKQFKDASNLFFSKNNDEKQYMSFVTLIHGSNNKIIAQATQTVTDAMDKPPDFGAKLLNDTLKTKEYKVALSRGGQGILVNFIDKVKGKSENWGGVVMYAKNLNLDDWNLKSESEKADILAHQAMDRY